MRHTMALGAKPSVRRPREQAILMVFLTALVTVLCSRTVAAEDKTLSISVLQFGTAHWELDHIRHAGLDEANGYQLELRPVANLPASRLAVTSGSVNGAVADLLWVQSRYTSGSAYFYVPFSSQIGDVVVASESDIRSVADLVGRRVGVAGGPDSKGWILLTEVARDQGLALADSVELQFGAPRCSVRRSSEVRSMPSLPTGISPPGSRARGWRSAFRMEDLLGRLGLDTSLPVLGYVFPKAWADEHISLVRRFARSVRQAKQQLAANPEHWNRLKSLMRDPGPGEFDALREGFLAGTPEALTDQRLADLHRLLELTGASGDNLMPAELFLREAP